MPLNLKIPAYMVLVAIVLTGCLNDDVKTPDGFNDLEASVNEAGFDLSYPLSTEIRVGNLYQVRKTSKGTEFKRTLCKDTFNAPEYWKDDSVILADHESNRDKNFEFVAGLSEKLLKDRASAQASLDASSVKTAKISFGEFKKYELPPTLRLDGTERKVNQICEHRIKAATKSDGSFTHPTFLVIGTLATDELNYQFDTEESFGGNIEVQIKGIFKVEPKVEIDDSGKKTLVIAPDNGKHFTVGVQAIALSHAKILDEVSNGMPVMFTEDKNPKISPDKTYNLQEK